MIEIFFQEREIPLDCGSQFLEGDYCFVHKNYDGTGVLLPGLLDRIVDNFFETNLELNSKWSMLTLATTMLLFLILEKTLV